MGTRCVFALLVTVIAGAAAASDCGIENAARTEVGPNGGVTGTCSNNGGTVDCSYGIEGEITCNGPEGTFNGNDLDGLIASACGCGA